MSTTKVGMSGCFEKTNIIRCAQQFVDDGKYAKGC